MSPQRSHEVYVFFYAAYFLWTSGISLFHLLTSMNRSALIELRKSPLWPPIALWVVPSVIGLKVAWPLLLLGPPAIVSMGAPLSAMPIMYGFLLFTFYLDGQQLASRTTLSPV